LREKNAFRATRNRDRRISEENERNFFEIRPDSCFARCAKRVLLAQLDLRATVAEEERGGTRCVNTAAKWGGKIG
jgi:hypothetical protein